MLQLHWLRSLLLELFGEICETNITEIPTVVNIHKDTASEGIELMKLN